MIIVSLILWKKGSKYTNRVMFKITCMWLSKVALNNFRKKLLPITRK